jgi:hypothetical protein
MRRFGHAAAALTFAVVGISVSAMRDASAEGGPPLLTDDPGTPGDGNWEINLSWTSERNSDSTQHALPLADINYGAGERVQLNFQIPWLVESGSGNNGFGDAQVGVKWRFFDQGEHGWQLGTYPQINFIPPGLHHAISAESGVSYLLPIEIQRDFGGFDAGFEIGRRFAASRDDNGWIAGIDVGRKVSKQLELMAELHDETADAQSAHELVLNVGARATFSERGMLLVSLGSDIENTIGPRNRWMSYLGLRLTP